MKKITLVLTALLLGGFAGFAQMRVGVTGGLQLANSTFSGGGISIAGSYKMGFMAGVMLDKAITDNLSVRPQLLYSIKGTKFDGLISLRNSSESLNYLEVPIQLIYGIDAGPGQVVLGAGPYIAYALSGKSTDKVAGILESEPIKFGSGEDEIKRLDYGLRLSAGYELTSGLAVSAFYSPGLANLTNDAPAKERNSAFGVSLSFLFGER